MVPAAGVCAFVAVMYAFRHLASTAAQDDDRLDGAQQHGRLWPKRCIVSSVFNEHTVWLLAVKLLGQQGCLKRQAA
jgi:hypothetical protein